MCSWFLLPRLDTNSLSLGDVVTLATGFSEITSSKEGFLSSCDQAENVKDYNKKMNVIRFMILIFY